MTTPGSSAAGMPVMGINPMMEMIRMSMISNLMVSMGSSTSTESITFKILQLCLILSIDTLIGAMGKVTRWLQGMIEGMLKKVFNDGRNYTSIDQFKYHMRVSDPVYRRLLVNELDMPGVLEHTLRNAIEGSEFNVNCFATETLVGARSRCLIEEIDQFIPIHKIRPLEYIYLTYTDNRTAGIGCNTSNGDLIAYLDGLNAKHEEAMKKWFTPTCYNQDGTSYMMKSKVSFDTVFFENKIEVVKILEQFKDAKWFEVRNLPQHLGMLLHGEPGTSKTTFVKAVARYMNRDVSTIDCSKIKTKKDFKTAIGNNAKRIILLEDFDRIRCVLSDGKKESVTEDATTSSSNLSKLKVAYADCKDVEEKKKLKKFIMEESENDTLDLAFVLNYLDGVVEMPGRMIIFTANHPERINPAMLRCGRIDHIIEFKKLTKKIIAEILHHFFVTCVASATKDGEVARATKLPNTSKIRDYVYTHAQVYSIAKKYNDLDKVIRMLEAGKIDLNSIKLGSSNLK
jgi:hypothetical protein